MNMNFSYPCVYARPELGCVVWHHKQVHKGARGGGFRGTLYLDPCDANVVLLAMHNS